MIRFVHIHTNMASTRPLGGGGGGGGGAGGTGGGGNWRGQGGVKERVCVKERGRGCEGEGTWV